MTRLERELREELVAARQQISRLQNPDPIRQITDSYVESYVVQESIRQLEFHRYMTERHLIARKQAEKELAKAKKRIEELEEQRDSWKNDYKIVKRRYDEISALIDEQITS